MRPAVHRGAAQTGKMPVGPGARAADRSTRSLRCTYRRHAQRTAAGARLAPYALGLSIVPKPSSVTAFLALAWAGGTTGDGGFGRILRKVATARRYTRRLMTVVFNDGAFGNVRHTQQAEFDGRLSRGGGPRARAPAPIETRVGEMASPWPLLADASAAARR